MADHLELYAHRPITAEHLARLSAIADEDRECFYRKRPEYHGRLLAVALCQGAARFYVTGEGGVKDLDVWSFFAAIEGRRFPADIRHVHVDFGPSELGRQPYDLDQADSPRRRRDFEKWSKFKGRRVDLMLRGLDANPGEGPTRALRRWLDAGVRASRSKPSNWWLAQKAVVLLDPADRRGERVWPPAS